ELAAQQPRAATGIDQPVARERQLPAVLFVADGMLTALRKVDLAHHRAGDERDALRTRLLAEEVLQDAAVELVAGCLQVAAGAELGHGVDARGVLAEEEPETELAQLALTQVRVEAEDGVQVVSSDLDRRFTHLVSRLRRRMRIAFEHRDGQPWQARAQLQGQRQARESAADDEHVGTAHRFSSFNSRPSVGVAMHRMSCRPPSASASMKGRQDSVELPATSSALAGRARLGAGPESALERVVSR